MTIVFDEFFESGKEESVSPFLTPDSRKWGKNLPLKSAYIAAFFLLLSIVPSLHNISLLLSYFFAGIPALISSVKDVLTFEINIDVLMTLAAFLSILIGSGWEGALLLVLFSFSGALEEAVRAKAKGTLIHMRKLSPSKAFFVLEDGSLIERSVRDIKPQDLIHVKAGEVVPLDGIVVRGASSVNLVHLTGENLPQTKKVGDEVPSGARNLDGALTLQVLRTSADSTLSRIIALVADAEEAKPKLERWFDKVSGKYAVAIIALSFLFALTIPLFSGVAYLGPNGSIYRSLSFLIAASPCALIIALPIAYLSAISVSAASGVFVKGGTVFDMLAGCKKMALDKTGTLTEGELVCVGVNGASDKAIRAAYALERGSNHPIGLAICKYAESKKLTALELKTFLSSPGYGLEGTTENEALFIGNLDFILSKVADRGEISKKAKEIAASGQVYTILLMGEEVFFFRFKDQVREGAACALSALKKECKMELVMLTGDHFESAKRVAGDVGIDEFYADLRPDEKLQKIAELAKKENLAMVGDGINDAPALARASVGISMGKGGSQAAVDASDIVLLQDNIALLPWLVKKARLTQEIVRENLLVASLAIVVATTPAILGWIPLWAAVLLHEGGTVLVGLNALRLLKK